MRIIKNIPSLLLLLMCFSMRIHAQNVSGPKACESARHEYHRGNYREAIALYNECLSETPSMQEAYNGRAASKVELRDFAGALTDYSIVLELDPLNYDGRMGRAHVFYKLKRFAEARSDYLKLLSLDAGETSTIYFQKSASPTGTMQITTAQSDFKPVIFNQIGLSEYHLENFPAALSWLDSAIRARPREADYYVNRGVVKDKLGDPSAQDDFAKALSINPNHSIALSMLGSSPRQSTAQRKAYLNEAIISDSTNVYPYLERAYQYMTEEKYALALNDYDAALALEQRDPDIWLNRGFAREKLNDLKGAYSDYSQSISIKEDYAKAWLNRGNVLNKLGRPEDAVEDYTVAITYDPDYGAAFYNRSIVYQKMKEDQKACQDLQRAERLGMKVDPRLKEAVCK